MTVTLNLAVTGYIIGLLLLGAARPQVVGRRG
jgi:hypothetical protein